MIRPLAFDAAVARVVAPTEDRTVRIGVGTAITGVGFGLCAAMFVQLVGGFPSPLGLVFGGLFPFGLAAAVALGGVFLIRSSFDAEQSAHVGIWWAVGSVVAGATGLAIIVFEATSGVTLLDPRLVVAGNAATGGLGGLVVGWYDARRLAIAAERERERQRLADEHEKLVLLNRIVRHDIGNDLQVIAGMGDLLETHVDDDGEDALDRLQRTTAEAIDLTERIREFVSVLENEDDTLHPVSIRRIVGTQLDNARERHPNVTITVTDDLPDVEVLADELLATVVHNLVSNAIAHNDTDDPHVDVDVETTSGVVRLRVADDGPGVPDSMKGTLFERGELGTDSEGTGIGLYIVDMLVERYGGEVWVEDSDDSGAAFVVELSRVTDEQTSRTSERVPQL